MPLLITLAREILLVIASNLDPWTPGFSEGQDEDYYWNKERKSKSLDDLRNLRLACKSLHDIATPQLFRVVRLRPSDESAEKWNNLVDSAMLRAHAREVIIDSVMDEEINNQEPWEQPESWSGALERLGEFPGVDAVTLRFSSECASDDDDGPYSWGKDVAETESERTDVLDTVFGALARVNELPGRAIRALSIKNLQNIVHEGADGEDFKSVLSGLRELHVGICTEQDDAAPEYTITKREVKAFWGPEGFVDKWLKLAAQTLTSLTLYCDNYFGILPEFDTSDISFPNLRKLSLGNFSFTYDWQIDWIISHKGLRTLWLDDCPIVHFFYLSSDFGPNDFRTGEFTKLPQGTFYQDQVYASSLRWSGVFDKMREGLPELEDFRLAHGAWDQGQAFERRHGLSLDLLDKRYMAFNGGIGPSQWVESRDRSKYAPDGSIREYLCYDGAFDDDVRPPNDEDPAVEDADRKAFARLTAGLSRGL